MENLLGCDVRQGRGGGTLESLSYGAAQFSFWEETVGERVVRRDANLQRYFQSGNSGSTSSAA